MSMYETRFNSLSEQDLHDLFHSSNWDSMSAQDRLAACQEAHNRFADAHHMQRCEVVTNEMRGTIMGYFDPNDGRIHVNESVLETGGVLAEDGTSYIYPGSNAETLDTVFHESSHAYDVQLAFAIEKKQSSLYTNEELIQDALNRGIDVDLSRASDRIYVGTDQNPDIYRVQYCEKRAYETGELETRLAFEDSISRNGGDSGYQAYSDRLAKSDSYNSALNNLRTVYLDQNIDETINEQTKALYFNENADEDISGTQNSKQAVRSELSATQGGMLTSWENLNGMTNEHFDAAAYTQSCSDSLEVGKVSNTLDASGAASSAQLASNVDTSAGGGSSGANCSAASSL